VSDGGLRKAAGPAAFFALLGACWALWRTYHVALFLSDMGAFVDASYRISLGEVPYRDFYLFTTPLTFATLGACMKLFGQYYLVSRVYAALQCGALVAMTYLFCARALKFDRLASALLAVFSIVWSPQVMLGSMWYDGDSTFYAFAAGLLLYRAWSSKDAAAWWSGLGGAACAASFWYKQDIGAGAMFGAALFAAYWALTGGARERRHALAFAAGNCAVFALMLSYFWAHGALGDLWHWTVARALLIKWGDDVGHGHTDNMLLSPFTTKVDRSSKFIVLIYVAAVVSAWIRHRSNKSREDLALAGIYLTWLASFYAGLFTHHGQAYTTKMTTFACVIGMLGRPWGERAPSWLRNRAFTAAFLVGVVLLTARGVHYDDLMSPRDFPIQRLKTPRLSGIIAGGRGLALDSLTAYIDKNVAAGDDFLILDGIAVYFAAQRGHPHPFADFSRGEVMPADEDAAIADLERHRTRWYFHLGGVDDFRQDAMWGCVRIKSYIERNFQLRETGDGFTAWTRKDAAAP
jgi:hypothetical protein